MDSPVFRTSEIPENNNKSRKIVIALLIFILVIFVSSFSYLLGKTQNNGKTNVSGNDSSFENLETPTASINEKSATPYTTKPFSSVTPTVNSKTSILTAEAELDGYRNSDNTGNNSNELKIGRNISSVTRGFVSFDLSGLPQGTQIDEAKLRLFQVKVSGKPFNSGIELKIDHLTYGDSLDSSDYALPALSSNFESLSENSKSEWKEIDVTSKVRNDVSNARSQSQFRMHFQVELRGGNFGGDYLHYESAENTHQTGNYPQLIVKYH